MTAHPHSQRPAASGDDARRLVLGAAVGFRIDQVRVFVESLRQVGYGGEIIMLVGPFQFRLKSYLRRFGVRPLSSLSTRKLNGPIHAYRFEKFAAIAAADAGRYDQILVSDVRDVVFQRHPFDGVPATGCQFYLEGDNRIIAEEPTNFAWARKFLPADEVERIGPCRVSCCGVVLGGAAAMTEYLSRIARYLHDLPIRLRREGGADTVFHNRMAHLSHEVECTVVENNLHVATMGLEPADAYRVDDNGLIRTAAGHLPAILHQYDRIPSLRACVESRFT